MSRVLTNNVALAYAIEASIGVLPGAPDWETLEPNNITAYGAEISTTERRPISPTRGRKKGATTDLDSTVEFEADLTMDAFEDFAEGFVFAEMRNVEFDFTVPKLVDAALPVITTDSFDFGAALSTFTNGTLLAGKIGWTTLAEASLLYATGYDNAANNGLHALIADITGASTFAQVAGTLVNETPPANARVEVAGIRVTDDDLTFTKTGGTATLVSGGDVADWAARGIEPGMYIHIGSDDGAGAVQNAMQDAAADDTFGYARVTAVSTTTLTLDKLDVNLGASAVHTGDGVADVMFGRYIRNVATTQDADDNRYLERSYQFEASYPDLGGIGTDEYEYAIGNFANELALDLPLSDKSALTFGFIGTNSDDITVTRKTAAATPKAPVRTTAVNTSSDIASLSTDLISAVGDVCFKSLTLTLLNNVSPEKCLGTLGAVFMNAGLFEVNMEAQMLFTNKQIVNAVKNNTTVTFAAIMKNENGAIVLDIPSLTVSGGDREFPVDQSVLVNLTGQAFNDTTLGTSLGITLFATVPTTRP